MSKNNLEGQKPAFLKGLLWFKFSGTATLAAFLLPIHIFAIEKGHASIANVWFRIYLFILISCALFFSIYRTNAFASDIGFSKYKKIIGAFCAVLFVCSEITAVYALFLAWL